MKEIPTGNKGIERGQVCKFNLFKADTRKYLYNKANISNCYCHPVIITMLFIYLCSSKKSTVNVKHGDK